VSCIDDMFGKGYAAAHPELVAEFMQAAAKDYATAICRLNSEETQDLARSLVRDIASSLMEAISIVHDAEDTFEDVDTDECT